MPQLIDINLFIVAYDPTNINYLYTKSYYLFDLSIPTTQDRLKISRFRTRFRFLNCLIKNDKNGRSVRQIEGCFEYLWSLTLTSWKWPLKWLLKMARFIILEPKLVIVPYEMWETLCLVIQIKTLKYNQGNGVLFFLSLRHLNHIGYIGYR